MRYNARTFHIASLSRAVSRSAALPEDSQWLSLFSPSFQMALSRRAVSWSLCRIWQQAALPRATASSSMAERVWQFSGVTPAVRRRWNRFMDKGMFSVIGVMLQGNPAIVGTIMAPKISCKTMRFKYIHNRAI